MGTENAMLAATLADGHTVIRPAAQEPEVDDLIAFLCAMGADVERTYPDTIEIDGTRRLRGASTRVMPDRIETGTFLVGGRGHRRHAHARERRRATTSTALVELFDRSACRSAATTARSRSTRPGCGPATSARRTSRPRPTRASRPTSSRRPCVLLTQAKGTSTVHETIFEDRIEGLAELRKLGARIDILDTPPRRDPRPGAAPRGRGRRSATCGPAPRSSSPPSPPTGRRYPRRPPRPAGV